VQLLVAGSAWLSTCRDWPALLCAALLYSGPLCNLQSLSSNAGLCLHLLLGRTETTAAVAPVCAPLPTGPVASFLSAQVLALLCAGEGPGSNGMASLGSCPSLPLLPAAPAQPTVPLCSFHSSPWPFYRAMPTASWQSSPPPLGALLVRLASLATMWPTHR
jgi:hypothetical protein